MVNHETSNRFERMTTSNQSGMTRKQESNFSQPKDAEISTEMVEQLNLRSNYARRSQSRSNERPPLAPNSDNYNEQRRAFDNVTNQRNSYSGLDDNRYDLRERDENR